MIKDSGERINYPTGAVRDTNKGKIRWDLVPKECLKRVAIHYTDGSKKYDDHNWKKGIPTDRFEESMERHMMQYLLGETDEDHLSACVFNIFGIMWNQMKEKNREPAYIRLRKRFIEGGTGDVSSDQCKCREETVDSIMGLEGH